LKNKKITMVRTHKTLKKRANLPFPISEESRSKLRGILTDSYYPPDVLYPPGTSQNAGCRPYNPVAPFDRLGKTESIGSISYKQALACDGFSGVIPGSLAFRFSKKRRRSNAGL
jgi:hypothetical protein